MKKGIIASLRVGLATFVMLFATNLVPVLATTVYAGDKEPDNNPPGNNGTLKVHEFGTDVGTESTAPHVCAFNLEGFGFDANQSGFVVIEPQGQDTDTTDSATLVLDTNSSGEGATDYINVGTQTLDNGHYKVTMYGKDVQGNIDYSNDLKAKSKVIKVECEPAPIPVTAGVVTFDEQCGTANDSFFIPTTAHVDYGYTAGTHTNATGTVTVTATGEAGYIVTPPYTVSHLFTNVPCPDVPVTAGVTFINLCGTANDSYTIPNTANVTYKIGDVIQTPGVHTGVTGTVTITATAAPGYVISGPSTFPYTFTDARCHTHPPKVTICHATSSVMNPYVEITVSQSAVDGVAGNSGHRADHYGEHKGDIFNPLTMQQGDDWGDIIPPVLPFHTGLNWTTEGQAIYRNHCNVPPVVIDVCPYVTGLQTDEEDCVIDVCPLVTGTQTDEEDCIIDVCPNIEGTQTSVPAGMATDENGNCVTPGQGGGEVLGITTVAAVTPKAELVNTGHNSLKEMIVGMTIVAIALTTAGLARRRQLV